jgi:aromatic-L-amino-acid decarboxylase
MAARRWCLRCAGNPNRRYAPQLAALSRADSVALPHKWLYVPVDAGLVLVPDAEAMRAAFSLVPPYLRTNDTPWLSEYGFEQARPFRALKVWTAMRHLGLDGYRRAIEHDLAMAERLHDAARAAPVFEVPEPQRLSIVCLRHTPELAGDDAAIDRHNEALLRRARPTATHSYRAL